MYTGKVKRLNKTERQKLKGKVKVDAQRKGEKIEQDRE
jgi:hypothetical protein